MRYTSSPSRRKTLRPNHSSTPKSAEKRSVQIVYHGHVSPTHSLGVAAQVRLGCRRCHGERDVANVQEAEVGNAVGDGRAARAAGVGPAVDALLEEEPVEDELATTVEQLGQRPSTVRTLEAVVVLDAHHRHALAGRGEFVHRGRRRLSSRSVMAASAASHSVWLTTGGRATVIARHPCWRAGGPDSTVGAYSSSWERPSKVRLPIMSSATSG